MTKIKLAIIGSCVTREAFITRNNPEYKKLYEVGALSWQTSLVSFMSAPVVPAMARAIVPSSSMNEHATNTMNRDLEKTDRDEIEAYKPDYLLFDLYSDVRYGIAQLLDSYITNNSNNFRKTDYFKAGKGFTTLHMMSDSKKYMPILNDAMDAFFAWTKERLPDTRIVMNAFHYSSYYREGGVDFNFIKSHGDTSRDNLYRRLLQENGKYDELYSYIQEKFAPLTIDNRDKSYYGDAEHQYGRTPWHFGRPFFTDFMADLDRIVLEDKTGAAEPEHEPSATLAQ
ncbi:DUF6270 domain-containing protein [Frondihabitans sp. VKM Ac-2883]|uniref:DUF6270 domain-containing protein n=1 Tax=Frondihabitans sp. VKM Ac-2883 TaxID=2783823 RepID=UPI00188B3D37|nr:hypothetical protein [Frondihabitans sp. VKM Ac-2883]